MLNRLCTYWLPRYLLSVKLEEQQDENDPDDPSIVGVLKSLVASVSRMSSEDLGRAFSNGIDDDPSMNLFFEASEEINPRRVSSYRNLSKLKKNFSEGVDTMKILSRDENLPQNSR